MSYIWRMVIKPQFVTTYCPTVIRQYVDCVLSGLGLVSVLKIFQECIFKRAQDLAQCLSRSCDWLGQKEAIWKTILQNVPTNSPKAELDLRWSGKKKEEMDWFLTVKVKEMWACFEMNGVYWSVILNVSTKSSSFRHWHLIQKKYLQMLSSQTSLWTQYFTYFVDALTEII